MRLLNIDGSAVFTAVIENLIFIKPQCHYFAVTFYLTSPSPPSPNYPTPFALLPSRPDSPLLAEALALGLKPGTSTSVTLTVSARYLPAEAGLTRGQRTRRIVAVTRRRDRGHNKRG